MILYSPTMHEYLSRYIDIFHIYSFHILYIREEVAYLGHLIVKDQTKSLRKVHCILNFHESKTPKDIKTL